MAGFTRSGGEANVPGWKEDTNSPFAGTSASSINESPQTGFERYLLFVTVQGNSGSDGTWEMTFEGVSSGYNHRDEGDSTTSDSSFISLIVSNFTDPTIPITARFDIRRVNGELYGFADVINEFATTKSLTAFRANASDISPIEINHSNSSDMDYTLEVYHR